MRAGLVGPGVLLVSAGRAGRAWGIVGECGPGWSGLGYCWWVRAGLVGPGLLLVGAGLVLVLLARNRLVAMLMLIVESVSR